MLVVAQVAAAAVGTMPGNTSPVQISDATASA
jgi:hypothetical protein